MYEYIYMCIYIHTHIEIQIDYNMLTRCSPPPGPSYSEGLPSNHSRHTDVHYSSGYRLSSSVSNPVYFLHSLGLPLTSAISAYLRRLRCVSGFRAQFTIDSQASTGGFGPLNATSTVARVGI